ncbi:hypothetical protein AURDEDRAFT_168572 [Auricularia subglabra TFB-10046 SS5]|nr:hypothetical protein AURDEDRAFT_168572 [Auricularia subglabra TFB-10046 SS5]
MPPAPPGRTSTSKLWTLGMRYAQAAADAAAERQATADAAVELQRIEDARAATQREAEEAEHLALEASRAKFNVDKSAQAPAYAEVQAPLSARDDIRKGKFVEWHLFTPEMCMEDRDAYQKEPEYKLTKLDNGSLVMRSTRRATKTPVILDNLLIYEQWSSGIPAFLRTIKDVGWSEEVVDQWNMFLFQLQLHPARAQDPRAIVIYAAGIRADWHRDFSDNKKLFNVALIHGGRIQAALDEAKKRDTDANLKVCCFHLTFVDEH